MTYLIPAAYTGVSSYDAHNNRRPPSSEPGTDLYMPTGTLLRSPTKCRVVEVGGSIHPATGRYITVDDGTRWLRFLHLSEWLVSEGDELEAGDPLGKSGASGYGSEFFGEPYRNDAFWRNTGGDHVHITAFNQRYYVWGKHGSTDFMALTGGKIAPGKTPAKPADPIILEDENMPVIIKHEKKNEWTLLDPDVGTDLPMVLYGVAAKFRSTKTASGVMNVYRGFMVTTDPSIAAAWGRSYCRAYGNAPQTRTDVDYKIAQAESSRLSAEKHR